MSRKVSTLGTGYLAVSVFTGDEALPIYKAVVVIKDPQSEMLFTLNTNENGRTETVSLAAPDKSQTLDPNAEGPRCSTVVVAVTAPGFRELIISGVSIFDASTTFLPIRLKPITGHKVVEEINIPRKPVETFEKRNLEGQPANSQNNLLKDVIIPKYITVQMGSPCESARRYRVRFVDYIKNAASHEVFDTWPRAALEANILSVISFTLNRVHSKWYRDKGHKFDVTNDPVHDPCFVHYGGVGGYVSEIVDEVFNKYVRQKGSKEPHPTTFCSVGTACPGLYQWGSVPLAKNGSNSIEILQNSFADDIELVETYNFEDIEASYPGYSLQEGFNSEGVGLIKPWLNRVAVNYPSIPRISSCHNNRFDAETVAAVTEFQKVFRLIPDGVVGKTTWHKLAHTYSGVKRLSDLHSSTEYIDINHLPSTVIREGCCGSEVALLQHLLSYFAEFYPNIPFVTENALFDEKTKDAVLAFQDLMEISKDGVVGPNTWRMLYSLCKNLKQCVKIPNANPIPQNPYPEYPGHLLRKGSSGEPVRFIQGCLNSLSKHYPSIPGLAVDGVFGNATEGAVKAFQSLSGIKVDGLVGPETWRLLVDACSRGSVIQPSVLNPQHMYYNDKLGAFVFDEMPGGECQKETDRSGSWLKPVMYEENNHAKDEYPISNAHKNLGNPVQTEVLSASYAPSLPDEDVYSPYAVVKAGKGVTTQPYQFSEKVPCEPCHKSMEAERAESGRVLGVDAFKAADPIPYQEDSKAAHEPSYPVVADSVVIPQPDQYVPEFRHDSLGHLYNQEYNQEPVTAAAMLNANTLALNYKKLNIVDKVLYLLILRQFFLRTY